jgi:hypothetical protein
MKITLHVLAVVVCALSTPIVSAQEQSAPDKSAMSIVMGNQMPQMQENMRAMQENMQTMHGMGGPMMMMERTRI